MIDIEMIEKIFQDAKVLFVEDDVTVQKMSLPLYKKIFGDVDMASNGEAGLELFRNKHYDIIITDYSMPKMNGCEMLENIFKITPNVITILLTARESCASFHKEQIDISLSKPFVFADFITALESIEEKYRLIKNGKNGLI